MKRILSLTALAVGLTLLFAFKSQEGQSAVQVDFSLSNQFFISKNTKTMTIDKEIIIDKNIEDAWEVLGHQFEDVWKWASPVNHSAGTGSSFNGATCSERGCSTTLGALKEKLLEYSDTQHKLTYEVAEGMPAMVKYATNTWELEQVGPNKTRLKMQVFMQTGGLTGAIMGPMMRMKMAKIAVHLTEDFKYYVENGQPHPRKVKAMQKAA